ncbi:hypothetical protein CXG81DRAFT_11403 [Caulochytrium protostelioides]|uniref:E3 ubiquitin-protein ligase CHIP n=1 Tax=Caulochytrium protostelioides TaxID=1555241 RepID=A0A4P9X9E1_9FUNG|nr:hypothetical protein CXG81DRAFT_11403 [Caulochytrium protostelioides]|eukprot:RKP01915.1 hypothetical protein CXG81DRAFT_11403 [Caulochytrium protostelioides]
MVRLDVAERHKIQGNEHFARGDYAAAIAEYSLAIIQSGARVTTYLTNRALAYLQLGDYDRCVDDCRKALELDPQCLKAHYRMGQALSHQPNHTQGALKALERAYRIAIEQKLDIADEIARQYRACKKTRWEVLEKSRRETETELYAYLCKMVNRDRERQLAQLSPDASDDDRLAINNAADHRLTQIQELYEAADPSNQLRPPPPDAFLGKISFEIMTDPVVAPSGITYDRTEIMSHLNQVGPFDPLARTPLSARDLYPNLALREVIDAYLAKNGWAVDY